MAKVTGGVPSMVRGVSQQPPELRLAGQVEEQVNYLPDATRGLSRRRGTQWQGAITDIGDDTPANVIDLSGWGVEELTIGTTPLSLTFRKEAKNDTSDLLGLACFNTEANTVVPIVLADGEEGDVTSALAGGLSAVGSIGRFVLMAVNGNTPAGTTEDLVGGTNAQKGAIWIRSGTYRRTYTAKIRIDGVEYVASVTTPAASYPAMLDTTGISGSGDAYTKAINDAVNAYNGRATAWLGDAAGLTQPEKIVAALYDVFTATSGHVFPVVPVTDGASITKSNGLGISASVFTKAVGTLTISHTDLEGVEIDDGGDGTLARAVYSTVASTADLTSVHYAGKVVKIVPINGDETFYMRAVPKVVGATGFTNVRWEEGVGEGYTAGSWWLIGMLHEGNLVVARTHAGLADHTGEDVPDIAPRAVGDADTSPSPYFVGRQISLIYLFQDRLVIGCGPVINMSRIGDYFNFFRKTVISVIDDDPIEVYSLGGDDDTLRHAATYDRSMYLFGDKRQYSISGRNPVTPRTTSMTQSSAHAGLASVRPVVGGSFVFAGQTSGEHSRLMQLQLGTLEDSPELYDVSLQVSAYMRGAPRRLAVSSTPTIAFMQADGDQTVYAFTYTDTTNERLLQSWGRLEFSPMCGKLLGMTTDAKGLVLYWARATAGGLTIVVDRLSLDPSVPLYPYLDSQRPYQSVMAAADTEDMHADSPDIASAVARDPDNTTYEWFGEAQLDDIPAMMAELAESGTPLDPARLVSGFQFQSDVTLSPPVMQDRNGAPQTGGRLTIRQILMRFRDTAAFTAKIPSDLWWGPVPPDADPDTAYRTVVEFNGRTLGRTDNISDVQPVVTGQIPVHVGREARQFTLTFSSVTWLPVTFNGYEWTGMYFEKGNQ